LCLCQRQLPPGRTFVHNSIHTCGKEPRLRPVLLCCRPGGSVTSNDGEVFDVSRPGRRVSAARRTSSRSRESTVWITPRMPFHKKQPANWGFFQ
jgi:hypothetical protein